MSKETELANKLEHCAAILQRYARVLRGEEQDLTGRGLWRIFQTKLEAATGMLLMHSQKEIRA